MIDLQRLRAAFQQSLDLPPDYPVEGLRYRDSENWDSLAHMSLCAAIEDEFGVMLNTDDVINISSFPAAVRILGKHGVDLHD